MPQTASAHELAKVAREPTTASGKQERAPSRQAGYARALPFTLSVTNGGGRHVFRGVLKKSLRRIRPTGARNYTTANRQGEECCATSPPRVFCRAASAVPLGRIGVFTTRTRIERRFPGTHGYVCGGDRHLTHGWARARAP